MIKYCVKYFFFSLLVVAAIGCSHNKKNKLCKILKKNNINNLTIKELFEYFEKSIKYRELAKFYYTKYISDILKILKSYGKHYGLRPESVANLDIDSILSIEKKNNSKIELISIAPLMAEAIKRISNSTSVSDLFN